MQVRGSAFDVIVLVVSCSTFRGENSATVDILEVTIGKLIPSLGMLRLLDVYPQVPFGVLLKPILANELVLLFRDGPVFTPLIPLVKNYISVLDQVLCTIDGSLVQSDGHDPILSLL